MVVGGVNQLQGMSTKAVSGEEAQVRERSQEGAATDGDTCAGLSWAGLARRLDFGL